MSEKNVVIDIPDRIDQDIEDFKLDAIDDEKNYTASRIKLCRDPENEKPILFYSQELSRNFKNPNDPFSKRHIIKTFTPENIEAVADVTVEHKFKDTLLAHKFGHPVHGGGAVRKIQKIIKSHRDNGKLTDDN